jgi:capsular polysaccharide biosynthesis protein
MSTLMKTTTEYGDVPNRTAHTGNYAAKTGGISLQSLINQMLTNSMSMAFRSKSLVINEVSRHVQLSRDKAIVAPVIRDLLSTVISNARNGDICISAERFRNIITLQIQDRNNYNGYALAYSIRAMEAEAAMVGGSISITGEQKKVITISFSFPDSGENFSYDC